MPRSRRCCASLRGSQRQHVVDFEAAERGVVDWPRAGEIGRAGGERRKFVLGGERALEMGGEHGGVDVEDIAVELVE